MGIWYSLYLHLVLYALESPNTSLKFYATVNLSSTRWPGGIDGLGVLHFMTHCKFLLGCGQWGSDGTLADEAPCLNASLRDSSKNLSNFFFFFEKKKKRDPHSAIYLIELFFKWWLYFIGLRWKKRDESKYESEECVIKVQSGDERYLLKTWASQKHE